MSFLEGMVYCLHVVRWCGDWVVWAGLFSLLGLSDGPGGLLFGRDEAWPHGVGLRDMLICNVTVEVIRSYRFQLAKLAQVRRLFLIVRAPEVLHQMRLLTETVETEDALVGPDPRVRAQVYVDIGFG